jgi:hypothetical protein
MTIAVRVILVMTFSSAIATSVRAQSSEPPPLASLTRGATHETRTIDVPGLTTANSACPISDDPTYGVTPGNPVKVGGDVMYVMSRSMRFLQALRGSSGQGLHLWRLGSLDGPDGTILDVYQVEHDGTVHYLYVDGYRWAELKAPRGFVCTAVNVGPPGPNPQERRRQLITLAATLGQPGPISLDPDGTATHGVLFDHVRLVARALASAGADGHPLDPAQIPGEINRPRFVAIAYPLVCDDDRIVPPQTVKVTDMNGNTPNVIREARNEQIRELVSGIEVPTSSLAIMYDADLAIPGQVVIGYGTGCDSAPSTVTLRINAEDGRVNGAPMLQLSTIAVAFPH